LIKEKIVVSASDRLALLESQIQQGIDLTEQGRSLIWMAVGEVHGDELWKQVLDDSGKQRYKTFEEYAKQRWGWERSNAFEVSAAGKVIAQLKESGVSDSALPNSVAQVRPLTRIAPELRVQVWQQVVNEGTPTAEAVKSAIAAVAPKSAPAKTSRPARAQSTVDVPAKAEPEIQEQSSEITLVDHLLLLALKYSGMPEVVQTALSLCSESERQELIRQLLPTVESSPVPLEQNLAPEQNQVIEQALLFLSDQCDGASKKDRVGFNGIDAHFGKSLAQRILEGKPLSDRHAESALKMLQKYKRQLSNGGIELPSWDEIKEQYQSPAKTITIEEDEYSMVLAGSKVRLYSPYDRTGGFQRIAKSIKGYKFEKADPPYWNFPVSALEQILQDFADYPWQIDEDIALELEHQKLKAQEAIAAQEAKALQKSEHIIELLSLAQLDQPLENGWQLRDYQRQGAEWLLAHSTGGIYGGGILADEMGLGKTLTALSAAKALQKKHNCPVLVVCPVSLIDNWHKEAAIAGVKIECFSWAKVPSPLEANYVLIADEAHYAQNESSSRTKKLLSLTSAPQCLAAWLLSGTPMKNGRPVNLFPLLKAIAHPLTQNRWDYMKRFCNAYEKSIGKGKSVWDFSGSSYLQELSQKTEDAILRRTKKECLTELPSKTRIIKSVDLESANDKAYRAEIERLVLDYRDRAKRGEVDPDSEALVTLNILRKVGSEAKAPAVIEFAQDILEQGDQVVIFTDFVESAKAIHKALGGELLTGQSKDRQAMVDRFQSGESKVFVGTIKAGGVGITLTAASQVILCDRPWTPGDCYQAEDRVHRLGQESPCFAYWLRLGEIDAAIDNLIHEKSERIELMLKGKRKTLRGVSSPKELAKELLEIL
jgi:SNF2 family DNA or RNA helicase